MLHLEQVMGDIVPELYTEWARISGRPPSSDMSRSNLCSELTLDFWEALDRRGYPARRELHISDAGWHFLIAHSVEPAADDYVTDLNPWRGEASGRYTGPLHGLRSEVMDILRECGLPEDYIALRSLDTLHSAHTLEKRFYVPSQRAS